VDERRRVERVILLLLTQIGVRYLTQFVVDQRHQALQYLPSFGRSLQYRGDGIPSSAIVFHGLHTWFFE
jgi:hypothetical protein